MAPKKKSPIKTVVKAKPKTGKKGAASVFPKDKGGRTWSENDRGLPMGHGRPGRTPDRPHVLVWVWNYGEGWELEKVRKS